MKNRRTIREEESQSANPFVKSGEIEENLQKVREGDPREARRETEQRITGDNRNGQLEEKNPRT